MVRSNTIDWLSRSPDDIGRVFGNRPVGLISTSIGPFGTILSQVSWLDVPWDLGTRPWFGRTLYVSDASPASDESGELIDQITRDRLQAYLTGFSEFVRQLK